MQYKSSNLRGSWSHTKTAGNETTRAHTEARSFSPSSTANTEAPVFTAKGVYILLVQTNSLNGVYRACALRVCVLTLCTVH